MRVGIAQRADRGSGGFTLLELLVSIGLMGLLFAGVISFFLDTTRRARDAAIVAETQDRARSLSDLMSFELRMTGSGMPLGQTGFAPGTPGLGDAPLPVLPGADAGTVTFRFSPKGVATVLTADFTPKANSRSFDVNDAAGLGAGDTVYLSNMPRGGEAGLRGVIRSINGLRVELAPGFEATAGAVFEAGSSLDQVRTVTYASGGGEIERDEDGEDLLMGSSAEFDLDYLDGNANALAAPLTQAAVTDQLAGVRFRLRVESRKALYGGAPYVTELTRTVALRNLLLED